ncbi:DUF1850 domain-containing protein [Haloparvum sedimenti]|uniref:DUF1850 domain-containing protein n=1 Tax=Haloparvum sedimenti TaxID=1678448 RepID=UPI00071E9A30|nr:DUF1850 domain-containing protein [Haloparvum sedimenti]
MNARTVAVVAFLAAVLAGGTAAAVAHPDSPLTERVIVVESSDGETLIESDAEGFVLSYTHSVEKTPVIETYERRDGRLVMTRMEFSSYGAGLPAQADVERTDNGSFVFAPNDSTEDLYVKPGRIAGHEIRIDGETHDLVVLSNAETVRIYVGTRTTFRPEIFQWD